MFCYLQVIQAPKNWSLQTNPQHKNFYGQSYDNKQLFNFNNLHIQLFCHLYYVLEPFVSDVEDQVAIITVALIVKENSFQR